jgi:hypothetical protein
MRMNRPIVMLSCVLKQDSLSKNIQLAKLEQ